MNYVAATAAQGGGGRWWGWFSIVVVGSEGMWPAIPVLGAGHDDGEGVGGTVGVDECECWIGTAQIGPPSSHKWLSAQAPDASPPEN